MTMMLKTPAFAASSLLVLIACSSACSSRGAEDSVGGYTNWLPCETLDDCPSDHEPMAAACAGGYCVDAEGERLLRAANAQAGEGGGGQGAGAGAGGGAGQDAGDGGASGVGGLDSAVADAAGIDAGPAGLCGSVRCALGQVCCDYCRSLCIPAASGALCPDDVPPAGGCDDAGIDAGSPFRIPQCPGAFERCAREGCPGDGPCVPCPAGQVCLELSLSCGPAGGSTAQCIDDPCAGAPLDCACASWVCEAADPSGVLAFCSATPAGEPPLGETDAPILMCSGGGICASPDTPVSTPSGDIAIASLRAGDLVYSLHEGQRVAVPLRAVSRTRVTHHSVVRIELDDGSVLEISAPHPLADGRAWGSLQIGEELDGRVIRSSELVDYLHPYTYDILPASDSGAYLAHGVWMGSTL